MKLSFRVKQVPRTSDISTIESLVQLPHDLHVLLRHRLLRQPHGFEGFCRLTIQLQFDDAAVADSENDGRVRVHLDSLSTPRVEVVGDDDRLTVLDELQWLDHHTLKRLEKVFQKRRVAASPL